MATFGCTRDLVAVAESWTHVVTRPGELQVGIVTAALDAPFFTGYTQGLTSSLLSSIAVRSAEILQSIIESRPLARDCA